MHGSEAEFLHSASGLLGVYYLLLCAMNWIAALILWRRGPQKVYGHVFGLPLTNYLTWFIVGAFFMLLAPIAMDGAPFPLWDFPPFSPWLRNVWTATMHVINYFSDPVFLTVGSTAALVIFFIFRRPLTSPTVAWGALNLSLFFMGMAMTNASFSSIVTKPDNVPIVGLVFLIGFFMWLATHKAVINDDRIAQGLPPLEKLDDEKVLVWPDLVYTEMICMIAVTAFLLIWGMLLLAPLEEPASSVKTPNPSKAPWYFLGLQEMLVYFDPWMAGVLLPSVVIFGLMAIPYLDFNRKGNGYYTIAERPFAWWVFQIGFLELWVVLIILGTFLRGPNWNFFGPFEAWDAHKVLAQNNTDLSQFFWISLLGTSLPRPPSDAELLKQIGYIVYREFPGILLTLTYIIALPPILALTVFRQMFVKMGFLRYMLMANLLLLMAFMPLKMVLRWVFNLKYIIHIDEFFLNL